MVLCSREVETSVDHWQMRPCDTRNGEPCSLCKQDFELEKKIHELQDRRRNLRRRMNASHDPFILKFPPEIASHIFCLSMKTRDYEPSTTALSMLPTSFLLGTICREWRQLARSTPQLWSALSFTLGKPTTEEALPQLQAISDWLQLSAGLPLTLWVISHTKISQESYPIIDTLNTHSARWSKVSLRLPAPYFRRFCGTSPPCNLRRLRIINTSNSLTGCSPIFNMTSRPSPTYLTIQNFPVLAIDIVWANLASLKVKNGTFNGFMEIIRQAPLLEFCSLQLNSAPTDVFPVPKTSVRLRLLRNLELSCFPVELLIRFIDALELPSLEEYYYRSEGGDIAADKVIWLLNRSGSRLKQLSLSLDGGAALGDVNKLLDAVPCLQNLRLRFRCPTSAFLADDLLKRLSSPPVLAGSTPGFLPQLQSLFLFSRRALPVWIRIPHIYNWSHRRLLGLEFKTEFGIDPEIDEVTVNEILQLIDAGIHIRILDGGQDYLQRFKQRTGTRGLSSRQYETSFPVLSSTPSSST